jgi:hypothetical protein
MHAENDTIDFWPEYRKWYNDWQFDEMLIERAEKEKIDKMDKWINSMTITQVCRLLGIIPEDYSSRNTVTNYHRNNRTSDLEVYVMKNGTILREKDGRDFASEINRIGMLYELYYTLNTYQNDGRIK